MRLATMAVWTLAAWGQTGTWPGEYRVERSEEALTLATPYSTFRHNLKRGGEIALLALRHGRVKNLLARPVNAQVVTAAGESYQSQNDTAPEVAVEGGAKRPVVRVTSRLVNVKGVDSGIRLRTRYEYRWGYVKVRREFVFGEGAVKVKRVGVFSAVFDASLEQYGYRQGMGEQEGVSPVVFGVMQWRRMRAGAYFDPPLQTRHVPRYLALVNPGIEGIEWFVGDDLAQWDYQAAGRPGAGQCNVAASLEPLGVSVQINALDVAGQVEAKGTWTFDSYLGVPLKEGHANAAWLHTAFGAAGGKWVSEETIAKWAAGGIRTVHCHNDGDALGDGLFWRDGTYPPYPPEEMKKYDGVIAECQKNGIRVATYFSNKELHPAAPDFEAHAEEWGRKPDDTGRLHHNRTAHGEYGAQMCLKSGWLATLKKNIDTVLKNHRLDGVYYDWNVALYCNNPLHVGATTNGVRGETGTLALSPTGHWDMDELLELMEWTRERVGPKGLVIIHNTMAPMFATENFADRVVGMEWGYGRLSRAVPPVEELPVEWSFAGARSRGIIGYGSIDKSAPARIEKELTLKTLMTGVAPWPANAAAMELYKVLEPLGDLQRYKFEDWRNGVVEVEGEGFLTAVYRREGEVWVLVGNTKGEARETRVRVKALELETAREWKEGVKASVPPMGAVLLRVGR